MDLPHYGLKVALGCVAAALGGIPGVAVGVIRTDVYGDAVLNITVRDMSSGRLLFEKEYAGNSGLRKMLFVCDSPETKALVVGHSLKRAMEDFKRDLVKAVESRTAK